MKILALDLGTRTGIAIGDHDAEPRFRSELLSTGDETQGARFYRLRLCLNRLVKNEKPDLIMIERPIPAGPKGKASRSEMAFGLRGIVHMIGHEHHTEIDEVSIASVRKHFLGQGRLQRDRAKAETIRRCRMVHAWMVENDDEADALAIWDYTCAVRVKGFEAKPQGELFR